MFPNKDTGREELYIDIDVKQFIETLMLIQNEDGIAHIKIQPKGKVAENKLTHECILNTYIPKSKR